VPISSHNNGPRQQLYFKWAFIYTGKGDQIFWRENQPMASKIRTKCSEPSFCQMYACHTWVCDLFFFESRQNKNKLAKVKKPPNLILDTLN
jgi:hypothetical protein